MNPDFTGEGDYSEISKMEKGKRKERQAQREQLAFRLHLG